MITVELKSYNEETSHRAGSFLLAPSNNNIPIILNQPYRSFKQTSWIQSNINNKIKFQPISADQGSVKVLNGTSLSFQVTAIDTSTVTEPLTYQWSKDGAQLYKYNEKNNGQGLFDINIINIKLAESGTYICKVINKYGSVDSTPLTIVVVDPKKEIILYRNLIINGDGDGGLTNWDGDSDAITSPFVQSNVGGTSTMGFGSFNFGGPILFAIEQGPNGPEVQKSFKPERLSHEFHFNMKGNYGLFFLNYHNRKNADPNFKDPNVYTFPPEPSWPDSFYPPQIIQNEDLFELDNYAAFFPGMGWMDKYNKNKKLIGLLSEVVNKSPSYFTRDKIKFKKFDGNSICKLSQNIDLSPAADLINGSVAGVAHVTSQFFAYVGAGITGYKIKVITDAGPLEYNYHTAGSEQLYDYYVKEPYRAANPEYKTGQTSNKEIYVQLLANTPIEITPLVDDTTDITIDYLHADGRILKSEIIPGPRAKDVWAIKEKVYFPLTLHFLSQLTLNGDHPIKVFGQTYTYTNAINAMFNRGVEGLFNNGPTPETGIDTVVDKNANFILKKYKIDSSATQPNQWWAGWNAGVESRVTYTQTTKTTDTYSSIPSSAVNIVESVATVPPAVAAALGVTVIPSWTYDILVADIPSATNSTNRQKTNKTIIDLGAAAMFGVGRTTKVPTDTTSVKITVAFTNTSEAADDQNPELKGWTKEEIYCNDFGKTQDTSQRTSEYGNPRCGVTKMKFQLFDNNINISENYLTYDIPPANSTVLGMQKEKYMDTHAFNTAYHYSNTNVIGGPKSGANIDPETTAAVGGRGVPDLIYAPDFNYNLIIPDQVPQPLPSTPAFIQIQMSEALGTTITQAGADAAIVSTVLGEDAYDNHGTAASRAAAGGAAEDVYVNIKEGDTSMDLL